MALFSTYSQASVNGYKSIGNFQGYSLSQDIVAGNTRANLQFGRAVDIDNAGNTIVVTSESMSPNFFGAMYFFTNNNNVFTESQVIGITTANTTSGASVAMSGNGLYTSFLVVNTLTNNFNVNIYNYNSNTWSLQQTIDSSDSTASDGFGRSMKFNDVGDYLVIGAPVFNSSAGAAYIFTRSGNTWSQQQKLSGGSNSQFGYSVSMNANGDKIAIGAPSIIIGTNRQGAVYIYDRTGSTWNLTSTINSPQTGITQFGTNISLSKDGTKLFVNYTANSNSLAGAMFYLGNATSPTQFLPYPPPSSVNAGSSSVSGDGNILVSVQQFGFIHTNYNNNDNYILQQKITSQFGASCNINSNGSFIVFGNPSANTNAGRLYIYKNF